MYRTSLLVCLLSVFIARPGVGQSVARPGLPQYPAAFAPTTDPQGAVMVPMGSPSSAVLLSNPAALGVMPAR